MESLAVSWSELTQDVNPALWQTVHTGFDGFLTAHIKLFNFQSPAQGASCRLHQRLTLTEVPHGGIDCKHGFQVQTATVSAHEFILPVHMDTFQTC